MPRLAEGKEGGSYSAGHRELSACLRRVLFGNILTL
jgi:hypothetical protein